MHGRGQAGGTVKLACCGLIRALAELVLEKGESRRTGAKCGKPVWLSEGGGRSTSVCLPVPCPVSKCDTLFIWAQRTGNLSAILLSLFSLYPHPIPGLNLLMSLHSEQCALNPGCCHLWWDRYLLIEFLFPLLSNTQLVWLLCSQHLDHVTTTQG